MNKKSNNTVVLVGPKAPLGGFGKFVNDFCQANPPFKLLVYDTFRTSKQGLRPYRMHSQLHVLFNAGFRRFAKSALLTVKNAVAFPRYFKSANPAVVYFVTEGYVAFWDIWPYMLYIWNKPPKVILHWLGPLEPFYRRGNWLIKYLVRKIVNRADESIVLTRTDEDLISNLAPARGLHYLPSSVEIATFGQVRHLSSKGPGNRRFRMLFMGGSDHFRKGLPTLLQAYTLVRDAAEREVELVVSGQEGCVQLINEMPVAARSTVSFVGLVSEQDKPGLLRSCDVMLLPSFDEGMPYSLVEAMASSLPIIATNVGGIPDIVRDGENGFLVSPGEPRRLADKILTLLNNPVLCRAFGRKSLALARQNHSLQHMYKQLFQICLAPINVHTP